MMKKRVQRTICLLLTLILALSALTACSSVDSADAVSYQGNALSRAVISYLCAVEKTNYLYEAYGITSDDMSASELQDNEAIWSAATVDGLTVADNLKMDVLQQAQETLYFYHWAVSQGYTLTADVKASVKAQFDKMIRSFETKGEFSRYMSQYGADYDTILNYNYIQTVANKGQDLLFGEEGTMAATDTETKNFFDKSYITVGVIFINTKTKIYPNGKEVFLPEDEKAEKIRLAEELETKLAAGEDFATLAAEYSERGNEEQHADGYTFNRGGFENAVVEEKAFDMSVGDTLRVDTDEGVYILRRMTLNDEHFANEKIAIRYTLNEIKKFSLLADELDRFTVDSDFFDSIDIAAMPHMV